jgi:hypothetical protein
VRAGDLHLRVGQVAKDANGNMICGSIEEETAGTIESIRRIWRKKARRWPTWCA